MNFDHEYNTRAWAPDYAITLARHQRLGDAVRARPGALLDVAWGKGPRQKLDFFPASRSAGPLALFIHGGYWQYRTSTKESVAFLATPFLERGIAFCALSYELCPDVDMNGMVMQLREAARWMRCNTSRLGFSVERLTVLGHSAGGHLAAMLSLTAEPVGGDGGKGGTIVDAACGISGLYDLTPITRTYLNEALGMDDTIASLNSPITHVRADAPPMVLGVGALESGEFKRQSEQFGAVYPAPVFLLDSKDHYSASEALLVPGPFQEAVMRSAI